MPVSLAVAIAALEVVRDEQLSKNAELLGKLFRSQLNAYIAKSNIAISYQGVKGGYTLKNNPFEISLIDLIKAVEPNYQITECLSNNTNKDDCSYLDCCKIRDPLIEVQKKIDKVFNETKLAHII